jgi:hypothetical protein
VAGCCECGDEPSGSCATELVVYLVSNSVIFICYLVRVLLKTARSTSTKHGH